jgi:hypothetical protein
VLPGQGSVHVRGQWWISMEQWWNGDGKEKRLERDHSTLYFISCSNILKIIFEKTDKVRFGVYEK